jgi:glutamate 5-kinase
VAYSDSDATRIMGRKSSEIEALLGFTGRAEMIHRDDLVILHGPVAEAGETPEAAP